MHISLLTTQLSFFAKNRFLELEGMLSPEEECHIHKELLASIKNKELLSLDLPFFKEGRDLWRKSHFLKKWITKNPIPFLASSLMRCKEIRLGFDQALEISPGHSFPLHLHNLSSIQGIQCALLMRLSSIDEEKGFYCQKRGSLLFFQSNLPIYLDNPGFYWMVVFMENASRYIRNKEDPFTHFFKNEGYAFGDLLDRNPLFFT